MPTQSPNEKALLAEIAELRVRLEEAEETLRAIRRGEVDALVMESPTGPQIYTLQSADAESNRFLGEILTQISDVVIAIDLEQRITYFNAAAERQYGVRASNVLGRKIDEIYTKHWPSAEAEAAVGAALRERGEWQGEAVHCTFDGRELSVDASVCTLRDPVNADIGLLAIIRDITERKDNERLIKESQQQYVGIVESAMDAVITVDSNYTILIFNPAAEKMFGCPVDEAIGGSLDRFIPERYRHAHDMHITAFGRTHPANRKMGSISRVTGLRASSEEFPIEVSISHSGMGGAKLFTAILRDISERIQAEFILQEQIKLKDQLAKVAASVPGLICSFRLDPDGSASMPYASSAFESLYGIAHEAVAEDFSPIFARIHPDDIGQLNKSIANSAHNLQPWQDTFRYNHPRKGEIWVEGHSMPQQEPDGSIIWQGYIQDVTERICSEQKLQERENELLLIMDATPALIAYLDTDFRYVRVNKTYEHWFCKTQESILGHEVHEIIGEKAWTIVRPFLERARSGERVRFDYQIPYGTGKPRWVQGNYIPERDASGIVKGIVVHVMDIDDRKLAEKALNQSELRFRQLAETIRDVFWISEYPEVRISYVSPAYHSLWGFNSDELYRDPDAWIRSIHPEDREQVQAAFTNHAILGTYDQQYRMIVADGSVHFIHERCFPVRDEQGKVYRLTGIARDMTEQRTMEKVLHESQQENELLGQLIRHSNLAIGIGYPDGSLGLLNPAFEKLTGYSANELLAIDWSTVLTPPEWHDFERDQLASLQYNDQSVVYEKEYIRKNGSLVPVELLVHLTTDSVGKPLYYYAFVTDISARKAAQAALQENEQRMRLATEATGVGIWEWNVHTNQIHWDAQMFRIYGIAPTPNGFINYHIWSETVLPEDLLQQEMIMQDTIDHFGRSSREFRIHRADHQECRYIHSVETVRTNALGQVEWVVGTNLDVTEQKLHLKALQASETRLALGVHVAGLALMEIDYTTAMSHLSAEAAQLFGLGDSGRVVPRSTVHATCHPDDQAELMRRINESLNPAGAGWFAMDHRVLWPGGAVRWLRVRQQIFFSGKSGERHPVHAILAAHDITAEMTVAEAIRTNEAFVRGVLNSLPEHIVVLDDNGVVSAVNESWERFAVMNEGTPSTVSVGANYLEVCRRSSFAGDLYAREALKGLESILAGSFEEFVMEYPCPTPDNKLWFLLFAKRMIKGHQGIILSHVNITERKRAEVELRNTQARLALIVEEVQAGYWDLNLKTKALYVSPEWSRQIGFDANEQTYQWQQKDDRLHPDDRAMVATATENFIAGHLPVYELDFRLRHKNGSYRWIHSRGALLRDSNNQPTRMLGLNLDITDYKRARELNEQRDKMEDSTRLYVASQTAAAIAHEMNQPLTAISYYADVALQLLQTGNENPQKLSRILESCSQQAQRAGQVIRQLMTVLHKGEALNESIDINRSVLDAFDFIRSNDFLRAVKLELNLASILPPVLANALQIQKILINLARNSLESIQENCVKAGSVTATTHIFAGNPAFAQVTVSDNGKGVTDAASLKAMFEPFHTTKATGLGMGLAISRALIEAHGGKMWAEQNAGPGISVHFTLPFVL